MITVFGRPLIRRRKPRVLLVPNQWSGSVQEYYHFILGYLGPIVLWLERHPGKQIAIRDCGPMQPWLDVMLADVDVTIMNPGGMLHMFAGKVHKSVVLRGLDDPTRFNSQDLGRFRTLALRRAGVGALGRELDSSTPDVTIIDRATSGSFNATAAAEVPASGAAVRSTPNLAEAVAPYVSPGTAQLIDTASMPPVSQLGVFSGTRVLVGQHGAGLANMVWMPRGGVVIEILPPLPPWVTPIFANLAAACGHQHIAITQADAHSPVDVEQLRSALDRVTGSDS